MRLKSTEQFLPLPISVYVLKKVAHPISYARGNSEFSERTSQAKLTLSSSLLPAVLTRHPCDYVSLTR